MQNKQIWPIRLCSSVTSKAKAGFDPGCVGNIVTLVLVGHASYINHWSCATDRLSAEGLSETQHCSMLKDRNALANSVCTLSRSPNETVAQKTGKYILNYSSLVRKYFVEVHEFLIYHSLQGPRYEQAPFKTLQICDFQAYRALFTNFKCNYWY